MQKANTFKLALIRMFQTLRISLTEILKSLMPDKEVVISEFKIRYVANQEWLPINYRQFYDQETIIVSDDGQFVVFSYINGVYKLSRITDFYTGGSTLFNGSLPDTPTEANRVAAKLARDLRLDVVVLIYEEPTGERIAGDSRLVQGELA